MLVMKEGDLDDGCLVLEEARQRFDLAPHHRCRGGAANLLERSTAWMEI